jgi:hypothetical protein
MQTAALIIAVLLAIIIILLIVLLLRTRRLAEQILLEEQEADEETPIVVYAAAPAISRYPLFDLRRQPPGMLNIPPPPSQPLLFNHPNGARLGRGPTYYK